MGHLACDKMHLGDNELLPNWGMYVRLGVYSFVYMSYARPTNAGRQRAGFMLEGLHITQCIVHADMMSAVPVDH